MGDPVLRATHAELRRTVVSAHLDAEHAFDRNLLWCATFQLAWNELCDFVGGPVHLSPDDPMVGALNARGASAEDVDPASCLARAGLGRDGIVEDIRKELHAKFGEAAAPELLPDALDDEDILAYAYLFENLAFATPFCRSDSRLRFQGAPVVGFGLWADLQDQQRAPLARQVTVRHYANDWDFVVELATTKAQDRLLIARLTPGRTLGETVGAALARAEPRGGSELAGDEDFLVPSLDFKILRAYEEIVGASLVNPDLAERYAIASATQDIRFRLDEQGALLKSEVAAKVFFIGIQLAAEARRRFVCDGPFLILMTRPGRHTPYLALWIDNTELLLPATPARSWSD